MNTTSGGHHISTNKQLAVLWDIENVKPSDSTFLLEDLMEFIDELGKPIIKRVYADWSVINRKISFQLATFGFELLHLPHQDNQKNSADILMTTDAVLLLTQYPWIDHYVFVTNDRDFRGLFQAITKHGKQIMLICDPKRTSTALLRLVDIVKDYRDFNSVTEEDIEDYNNDENINENKRDATGSTLSLSVETAQQLLLDKLVEAIEFLRELRLSASDFSPFTQADVLIRLKMVYPEYLTAVTVLTQNGILSKNKWFASLLRLAEKKGIIRLELYGATYHINMAASVPTATAKLREKYFNMILDIIKSKGDNSKINLSKLASLMNKKRDELHYRDLGYSQFMKVLLDMQEKNLIELQRGENSSVWTVQRTV